MADGENVRELQAELLQEIRELKKIAYMYHAVGNYAKADEIMSLIEEVKQPAKKRPPFREAA